MNKNLSVFISLLLMLSSALNAQITGKHLFILSGQSNMARLDPAKTFTPTVEAAFGKEHVIVVKDAMGGQPIKRWYKKWNPAKGENSKQIGDLYNKLLYKVNVATLQQKIDSVTFVWVQGERDAREQYGTRYKDSLAGLIQQIAADLGREDINLVLARLSDFDMQNKTYPHWTMIRDIQVEFAESRLSSSWVNTDDLNDGINSDGKPIKDDLHYSVTGYDIFGERLAEAAIKLVEANAQ